MGDKIKFKSISKEEFIELGGEFWTDLKF
jgi:hypothetical protein